MIATPILRRVRTGLAVTAILCLAYASALVAAEPESKQIGYVSGLTGEVVIYRPDDVRDPAERQRPIDGQSINWEKLLRESRAQLKQPIRTGDVILTRGGVVQVRFSDTVEPPSEMGVELAECRFANHSEVHLSGWQALGPEGEHGKTPTQHDMTSILELRRGEVHCKTKRAGSFRMRWNTGSASVLTQGTEMTITYVPQGERLTVTVHEGRVVVFTRAGSKSVRAGQTARFVQGRPEGPPA